MIAIADRTYVLCGKSTKQKLPDMGAMDWSITRFRWARLGSNQ
jgi:hypothetical protein